MPTGRDSDPCRHARTLRLALEGLAAALSAGDVGAVLKSEPALVDALADVTGARWLDAGERAALRADVIGARRALAQCRAIGAASAQLTSVTLETLGRVGSYGRHGDDAPRALRGREMTARA